MAGRDRLNSQWKYLSVRRTTLFIEDSLHQSLKWTAFEPNMAVLWGEVCRNVDRFLRDLYLQGALRGTNPEEAYFVKCDAATTTEANINEGVVNVIVGFAPVKPAEFLILQFRLQARRPGE